MQLSLPGTKETKIIKKSNKSATSLPDLARALRGELAGKIASLIGAKGNLTTDIPGLLLARRIPPSAPASDEYEPNLAVVVQGRKRIPNFR